LQDGFLWPSKIGRPPHLTGFSKPPRPLRPSSPCLPNVSPWSLLLTRCPYLGSLFFNLHYVPVGTFYYFPVFSRRSSCPCYIVTSSSTFSGPPPDYTLISEHILSPPQRSLTPLSILRFSLTGRLTVKNLLTGTFPSFNRCSRLFT